MRSRQISPERAWPRRPLRVRYRHCVFILPFVRNYRGMVVGRTILFKGDESEVSQTLFRHELIHQEQIDRHGIARFSDLCSRLSFEPLALAQSRRRLPQYSV